MYQYDQDAQRQFQALHIRHARRLTELSSLVGRTALESVVTPFVAFSAGTTKRT